MHLSYEEIFKDVTSEVKKIPKKEYQEEGITPIIDQSKDFICGYSDEEIGYEKDLPRIIFGDHTRIFKFIDFPFFIGADGVKVLKIINPKVYPKYIYYYLLFSYIPNEGYARHFKWVKKLKFNIPDYNDQKEIAHKLDNLFRIKEHQKNNISDLNDMINSKYNELFSEITEKVKIGEKFVVQTGGTPSTKNREYWDNGNIPWIGSAVCTDNIIYDSDGQYITELGLKNSNAKLFPIGTVLIALVGATIGKTALLKFESTTNQNIAGIIMPDDNKYTSEFVFYSLQRNYNEFKKSGKGYNMANLTTIRNLEIPDADYNKQLEFSKFVNNIVELKKKITENMDDMDKLISAYARESI